MALVTIAACFVTPGGVVFGADSTTTIPVPNHQGQASHHFFDHAQKLFEIGDGGMLGVVTWGLGAFDGVSYRKLFADLGDRVEQKRFATVRETVDEFISLFWALYSQPGSTLFPVRKRVSDLLALGTLNPQEASELQQLQSNTTAGFCIGGHTPSDRSSDAWSFAFSPGLTNPPVPFQLAVGTPSFWGMPNILTRIVFGIDPQIAEQILQSGMWTGTNTDLGVLVEPYVFRLASNLPIREAVDYVHALISVTCKGLKFSHLPPVCGGPVEIAVITADRRFRWVNHKTMGDALA